MTTSTASEKKVVHFSEFLAAGGGGTSAAPPAEAAPAGGDNTRSFSEFVASLPAGAASPSTPESVAPAAAAIGPEPQPATKLEDAVKKFGQSADESSKAMLEALAEQQKKTDARWDRAQQTLEKFAAEMAASSKALNKSLQEVAAALRPSPDSTAS